jgi:Rieske Fe-S protein
MPDDFPQHPQRRRVQLLAGCCVVGSGLGVFGYLAKKDQPPTGNPVIADVSDLPPGKLRVLDWQGRTLWILRRTNADVATLTDHEDELIAPGSEYSRQPENCRNAHRSLLPDVFVAMANARTRAVRRNCAARRAVAASSFVPAILDSLAAMVDTYRIGKSELIPGQARKVLAFLVRHIETRDARYVNAPMARL